MRNIWIHNKSYKWVGYIFTLMVLVVFIVMIVMFVNKEAKSQSEVRKNALREKISKTVTMCYSVEGRYPSSVEYMKKNYGLTYDEDEFYIHYEMIGSNLYPSYEVFVVNQE